MVKSWVFAGTFLGCFSHSHLERVLTRKATELGLRQVEPLAAPLPPRLEKPQAEGASDRAGESSKDLAVRVPSESSGSTTRFSRGF